MGQAGYKRNPGGPTTKIVVCLLSPCLDDVQVSLTILFLRSRVVEWEKVFIRLPLTGAPVALPFAVFGRRTQPAINAVLNGVRTT